jgi:hypothetical protein
VTLYWWLPRPQPGSQPACCPHPRSACRPRARGPQHNTWGRVAARACCSLSLSAVALENGVKPVKRKKLKLPASDLAARLTN